MYQRIVRAVMRSKTKEGLRLSMEKVQLEFESAFDDAYEDLIVYLEHSVLVDELVEHFIRHSETFLSKANESFLSPFRGEQASSWGAIGRHIGFLTACLMDGFTNSKIVEHMKEHHFEAIFEHLKKVLTRLHELDLSPLGRIFHPALLLALQKKTVFLDPIFKEQYRKMLRMVCADPGSEYFPV